MLQPFRVAFYAAALYLPLAACRVIPPTTKFGTGWCAAEIAQDMLVSSRQYLQSECKPLLPSIGINLFVPGGIHASASACSQLKDDPQYHISLSKPYLSKELTSSATNGSEKALTACLNTEYVELGIAFEAVKPQHTDLKTRAAALPLATPCGSLLASSAHMAATRLLGAADSSSSLQRSGLSKLRDGPNFNGDTKN